MQVARAGASISAVGADTFLTEAKRRRVRRRQQVVGRVVRRHVTAPGVGADTFRTKDANTKPTTAAATVAAVAATAVDEAMQVGVMLVIQKVGMVTMRVLGKGRVTSTERWQE